MVERLRLKNAANLIAIQAIAASESEVVCASFWNRDFIEDLLGRSLTEEEWQMIVGVLPRWDAFTSEDMSEELYSYGVYEDD